MIITRACHKEYPAIGSFYAEVGYSGVIKKADIVFLALEKSQIVGAVRLCQEEDKLVLRGMYVSAEKRRLGIGTALLQAVSNEIGPRECWCIPYSYLCYLYGQIGFEEVSSNTRPVFLLARLADYIDHGKSVVIMVRPKNWSGFAGQ